MFKALIYALLVVLTSLTYAQPKTKAQISNDVQSSHDYIVSTLSSYSSCQSLAKEYVSDLTAAHDLFLKDRYLPAMIKALNVTSLSARKSLTHLDCRSRAATSIPHVSLYLEYMQGQQNFHLLQPLTHQKTSPIDGDKAILIDLTDVINQRMLQACKASACSNSEKAIIYENNVIQKELLKEQPNYEVIAYWLSDIKGIIGTFYLSSNHIQELNYIHEKNTTMLRIIKLYVFQSPDFFGTFNSTLINLVINEAKPNSNCSQVLAQFLEITFDSPHYTLNRLIVANNKLYELLDEAIYTHTFYNSGCTITRDDLFNIPFTFTDQIKKQLYAI
jgi:hypothetical protein